MSATAWLILALYYVGVFFLLRALCREVIRKMR